MGEARYHDGGKARERDNGKGRVGSGRGWGACNRGGATGRG